MDSGASYAVGGSLIGAFTGFLGGLAYGGSKANNFDIGSSIVSGIQTMFYGLTGALMGGLTGAVVGGLMGSRKV